MHFSSILESAVSRTTIIAIESPHFGIILITVTDHYRDRKGYKYNMKARYKVVGLEQDELIDRIYKEISAIHGVDEIVISIQKQEMVIVTEEENLSRIEHAAIIILSYIAPQISIKRF